LKHAHVGVAILSHCPEWVEKKQSILAQLGKQAITETSSGPPAKEKEPKSTAVQRNPVRAGARRVVPANSNALKENSMDKQLKQMLKDLEDQEKAQIVKLGDASIAAPFSSKMASIECSKLAVRPSFGWLKI